MNLVRICYTVMMFIIINLVIISIILSMPVGEKRDIIKCYDRFSHEIKGASCYSEEPLFKTESERNISLIFGILIINILLLFTEILNW